MNQVSVTWIILTAAGCPWSEGETCRPSSSNGELDLDTSLQNMDWWHLTLKSRKSCSMKVRGVAICDQLGRQSSQCFDRHQFRWRLLWITKSKWDWYLMIMPSISITASKVHCFSLGGVDEKQRFYLRSHSERILFSIQSLGETPSLTLHLSNLTQKPENANGFILSTHFNISFSTSIRWYVLSVNLVPWQIFQLKNICLISIFMFWIIYSQCQLRRHCAHLKKAKTAWTSKRIQEVKSLDSFWKPWGLLENNLQTCEIQMWCDTCNTSNMRCASF